MKSKRNNIKGELKNSSTSLKNVLVSNFPSNLGGNIILVLLILINANWVYAQSNAVSTATEIYEVVEKIDEFFEYKNYINDVIQDLEKGKEPSSHPTQLWFGDGLLSHLKTINKDVANISIPKKIEVQVKFNNNIANKDINVRRQSLGQNTQYMLNYKEQLTHLYTIRRGLLEMENRCELSLQGLAEVKKGLGEIYQKLGGLPFADIFGFAYLDVDRKFMPAVKKIKSQVEKKLEILNKVIAKEHRDFENLKANLLIFLQAEEELLNQAESRYDSLLEVINEKNNEFMIREEELQSDWDLLISKIDQEKIAGEFLEKRQEDFKREIDLFNDKVKSLQELNKEINGYVYNKCPNGKSFNNCDHHDKKGAYLKSYNRLVQRYNDKASELQKAQNSLENKRSTLEQDIKNWNEKQNQFLQEKNEIEHKIETITTEREEVINSLYNENLQELKDIIKIKYLKEQNKSDAEKLRQLNISEQLV